ncbi:cysteine and tyrosine-rich protein 1-like [Mya arenaria]|uniref:cysteine and tyrosine-rich protein 1-like n=1 Tax=Mya arenaria TaxID=6604 RepID=UPI0022E07342|nr:cysteine and tyrosine-rich protein 1-like [Mya arenaria]
MKLQKVVLGVCDVTGEYCTNDNQCDHGCCEYRCCAQPMRSASMIGGVIGGVVAFALLITFIICCVCMCGKSRGHVGHTHGGQANVNAVYVQNTASYGQPMETRLPPGYHTPHMFTGSSQQSHMHPGNPGSAFPLSPGYEPGYPPGQVYPPPPAYSLPHPGATGNHEQQSKF